MAFPAVLVDQVILADVATISVTPMPEMDSAPSPVIVVPKVPVQEAADVPLLLSASSTVQLADDAEDPAAATLAVSENSSPGWIVLSVRVSVEALKLDVQPVIPVELFMVKLDDGRLIFIQTTSVSVEPLVMVKVMSWVLLVDIVVTLTEAVQEDMAADTGRTRFKKIRIIKIKNKIFLGSLDILSLIFNLT